jgi:hypothetical protein
MIAEQNFGYQRGIRIAPSMNVPNAIKCSNIRMVRNYAPNALNITPLRTVLILRGIRYRNNNPLNS